MSVSKKEQKKLAINMRVARWLESQVKKSVPADTKFVVVGFDNEGNPAEYPQRPRRAQAITTRDVGFGC